MSLTVDEASETYVSAMRNVPSPDQNACAICKTFIGEDWTYCIPCNRQLNSLDIVVPITYSLSMGQMHTVLRLYKDPPSDAQQFAAVRMVAILWRFLRDHESCIAHGAGVDRFDVTTTVPSTSQQRDHQNVLRAVVQACGPAKDRYERLLRPAPDATESHELVADRYVAQRRLDGERVLLVEDTWASGGHAQSAAYALKQAGAATVALVVVGRHINGEWEVDGTPSEDIYDMLPKKFDWSCCAAE